MLNNQIYIGSTNNLKERIEEHNNGLSVSTRRYKPWTLHYYEAYKTEHLARIREKTLKYHGNAIRELKKRIGLFKSGAGFTLIELLIVVTIIAILAAIGLVSYTTFLKNARDAKRQSDLKLIQSALEQYHADQTYYPASVTPGSPLAAVSKTYMTQLPSEPVAGRNNYKYEPFPTDCDNSTKMCTSYCLSASMENIGQHTEGTCSNPPKYNFTVTRP